MPYVNVPNDLSKIKTKIAFNLTKRQLICFGIGAAIGVPAYLLTRQVIRNIIRIKFTCPGIRPYRTENIYAPFARKEEPIEQSKKAEKHK